MFRGSNKQHICSYQTSVKADYFAELNSVLTNRVIELKSFASHKIVNFKNKMSLWLYNASSSTKSFWISVVAPVANVFYSGCLWIAQGFIHAFIIPIYRLRIKMNLKHLKTNRL